jgi:uncharacterized membrane protein YgdD (TMEM256/DUF423 family)
VSRIDKRRSQEDYNSLCSFVSFLLETMIRTFVVLGAILAGVSVAAGAFGAHGLRGVLQPDMLANFETAARYQMYHALAILIVGAIADRLPARWVNWIGWLFFAGVLLFSGSLYLMAFTGVRVLGAITPLGGVAFIAGWALLAVAALRRR